MKPTASVLIKLFAHRFYKAHAGLLLFFFVTVLISFFFVNVLNQTHLTEEDRIFHNLLLTIVFISSPLFTAFIFTAWLAYMIKGWSFTSAQLRLPQHQFLFYSLNAQTKPRRFRQWLTVQGVIAIPLIIYGLFALVIGIIYGFYTLPLIILLYIVILVTIGAVICIQLDHTFVDHHTVSWTMRVTRSWPKPFFTLPLYGLIHHQKISLLITKLLSTFILIIGIYLLQENISDSRVAGILALGIATAHAFVVYQINIFANTYLNFSNNFPYTITRRGLLTLFTFTLLVLPELAWFVWHHHQWPFAQAVFLIISLLLLFQTLAPPTTTTKAYLTRVFYLFVISFIILLFDFLPVLTVITLVTAIVRFRAQAKF